MAGTRSRWLRVVPVREASSLTTQGDLAIFNLAIDSKLRTCDLTALRVSDVCMGSRVSARATVMQRKTQRPVQFEITEQTRGSTEAWIRAAQLSAGRLPLSKSHPRIAAHFDPAVCSAGASMDSIHRA